MKPARLSTLFYFGFLIMELSYLYIPASLLGGPVYVLIIMLLLYPFALFSKFALSHSVFSQQLRFTLEVVLVTLMILLIAGERLISSMAMGQADVQGIILRIGLCGFIWFMGHTVPHERMNYSAIVLRLQIGLIAVLALSQVAGNTPPVFLFFLLAPAALFLARWLSSLYRGAAPLRTPNPSHLLLAAASVMLPGIALILIFSPGLAHTIVNWLGDIGGNISNQMAVPKEGADNQSKLDFSCLRQPAPEGGSPDESPLNPSAGSGGTASISPVVIWIVIFAIILAIVVLIAFTLIRRKTRRKTNTVNPVPFQIRMVSANMLRSLLALFPLLLKKLWLRLKSLFHRRKKQAAPSEEAVVSIRALYRNLLHWAARQGVARMPSQTPTEHLLLLEQRFPERHDDLKQVIEVYLQGRYSREPVSQEEFHRARKSWHQVTCPHRR